MSDAWIDDWIRAFLLTQMVEMGVYVQATARPWRERVAIAFGASAVTHPIVWFVIPSLVLRYVTEGSYETRWWIAIAHAETFAVTVEAAWLALFGIPPVRALLLSLGANACSFTIGLFLYRVLGW